MRTCVQVLSSASIRARLATAHLLTQGLQPCQNTQNSLAEHPLHSSASRSKVMNILTKSQKLLILLSAQRAD